MSGPAPTPTISTFLDRAIKAVPAIKYALGIGGVVAVIAIVFSFGINAKVAIFGTIIMLVLMVVLVLFASLVRKPGASFSLPALIFTWFSLGLFMASSFLLFTSAFWAAPLDLRTFISGPKPPPQTSSSSQQQPQQNPSFGYTPPVNQPTKEQETGHVAVDLEAYDWEMKGDKIVVLNILLEKKGPEVAQSPEELTKLQEALDAGFKQARTAWTNAVNTAGTKRYKSALQTKLKGSTGGGLTCEVPDNDDVSCYANGSEFDELTQQGAPALMVKHISNKH